MPLPTATVDSNPAPVAKESESTAESDSPPDMPAVAELTIGGLGRRRCVGRRRPIGLPSGVAHYLVAGDRAISFVPSATGGRSSSTAGTRSQSALGGFMLSWSGDGACRRRTGHEVRPRHPRPEGELATGATIDTGSFYLAWEPGGDDLVIIDDELFLLRDPQDLETRESLGAPGRPSLRQCGFQEPVTSSSTMTTTRTRVV